MLKTVVLHNIFLEIEIYSDIINVLVTLYNKVSFINIS